MATLKAIFSNMTRKKLPLGYLLSLIISVLLALLVGALIMLFSGHDPINGYMALIRGAFGSERTMADTLAKSATLCLTGLAMAVAAQAGIFNVGGEGQLYLGAIASGAVGGMLNGHSPILVIPIALLSAILAGGLYALIPAWLKVKLKVNEVITTIMLNSAALYLCSFLATGPLKTTERGISSGTVKLDPAFIFPKLVRLSNLTVSIFLSAGIAFFVWYLMKKTTVGFEMKLTGENERFARYTGIKTGKLALWSMVLSGAICGLVGMFEVYGIHRRFVESVSKEFYYDGMLVAMIMRYDPVGIILMSLFFGVLKIGATGMEQVGIPSETILIVQSIIIFFMAAENGISESLRARLSLRRAKKAAADTVRKAANHG